MPAPQRPQKQQYSGTYFVQDRENEEELLRLANQDRLVTASMGGVLPARPLAAGAPSFVISALRDPGTAAQPGTQLQRLQVVKGWIANGAAHQQSPQRSRRSATSRSILRRTGPASHIADGRG